MTQDLALKTVDFSQIRYNFQEIYQAVHQAEENQPPELVANLSGTAIYYAHSCWGIVLRIIYFVTSCIFPNFREDNLRAAFLYTHNALKEQLELVNSHVLIFEENFRLIARPKGEINHTAFANAKQAITECNDSVRPFLRLLKKRFTALDPFFRRYLGESTFEMNPDLLHRCHLYQKFNDLEGVLYRSDKVTIPYRILSEMAQGIRLEAPQKEEIGKFMEAVDNNAETIGIRLFHNFSKAMVQFFEERNAFDDTPLWKRVAQFEFQLLETKHTKIFRMVDPKHMDMRSKLAPNETVTVNDKSIKLGDQIGKRNNDTLDYNLIYEADAKEGSDIVLMTSINTAALGLKALLHERYEGILKGSLVDFVDVDEEGRFALVTRVSTNMKGQVNACQTLVQTMLKKSKTPIFKYMPPPNDQKGVFSVAYMGCKDRKLKVTRIANIVDGPLDFNAVEQFIFDVANNDEAAFTHLMKTSNIEDHKFTRFYRAVFDKTLEENAASSNIKGIAFSEHQVSEPSIVDRAQEFYDQVIKIKNAAFAILQSQQKNVSQEQVSSAMREQYKQHRCISILWPNETEFRQNVIKRLGGT